ncbi:MAG: prepilin-type N-terminal cleavage/methylation domain-containing protein [Planctomycetota bacterium]
MHYPRTPRAFSLIELLVAIAIIALLIAILLPALGAARDAARTMACLSNVRSVAQAQAGYSDTHRGWYPHWSAWHHFGGDGTGGDQEGLGWTELLSDQIETTEVYRCPSRPEAEGRFSYFIAANYTFTRFRAQFTSVRDSFIAFPSAFVMGGDCNFPGLYIRPYGAQDPQTLQPDCDMDDATQPVVFFGSAEVNGVQYEELVPHNGRSNIFFFDGHAAGFDQYEPSKMTWHASKMRPWTQPE